jgi:glycosyltransferase involved in cell wall biosynthesis
VVSILSRGLAERFDLTLALQDASGRTFEHGGRLEDLGCRGIDDERFLKRLWNTVLATLRLRRLKQRLRPDAVLSFLELSNIPNILSGTSAPLVLSVRSHRLRSRNISLQSRIANVSVRLMYGRAARVVAVSEGVRRHLVEDFGMAGDNLSVIYNPCDIEAVREMVLSAPEPFEKGFFDKPVLTATGRLCQEKGQWHLIRAFSKVREAVPGARLVIMGEGELRGYLEGLASGLGLSESVFLPGFVPNPFAVIARSDVFVFPSLWEGFPNALVEAMACGVPVLASDCRSGPREILSPSSGEEGQASGGPEYAEYGVLLPVCDGRRYSAGDPLTLEEEFLSTCMLSMLRDEGMARDYGERALGRAGQFAPGSILDSWEALVRDTVS